MNLLITICARKGSKGLPNKNLLPLNNIPLIVYSINIAKKFAKLYDADIAISSDDIRIIKTGIIEGLTVPYKRPSSLAKDSTGKIETIRHVLNYYSKKNNKLYDFVLDLDVSSPLRTLEDLNKAFSILRKNKHAYNIFSVSEASRNPYFNMVEKKRDGYFDLVKKGKYLSRQSAPDVYDMNASFYFYSKLFFQKDFKRSTTDRSLIYIMPNICFDIDNKIDFEYMEFIIKNKKVKI